MKRVTFARSTYSGVGVQTGSTSEVSLRWRGLKASGRCGPTASRYNGSMTVRVGVVGAGWSGFAPTTEGISYKELMFEAARRAYADAELDPRRDVDSWVCASEDFEEGTSIFDEYVPDQLGA